MVTWGTPGKGLRAKESCLLPPSLHSRGRSAQAIYKDRLTDSDGRGQGKLIHMLWLVQCTGGHRGSQGVTVVGWWTWMNYFQPMITTLMAIDPGQLGTEGGEELSI